jgi:hypothetical protein
VRIPFPERIAMDRVAIFAALLFLVQLAEGTHLYFCAGSAAFLVLAALTFNAAGGLTRPSGAYVFFYCVLVVVLGLGYKAVLGEPADSNLHDPQTTIEVYVASIAVMLPAVIVSRRLSRRRGLFQDSLPEYDMYCSCIGCIVFGAGGAYLISVVDTNGATLNKVFTQLNQLLPLGIIIGVMYEVRRSGGARSINLPVAFTMVYTFLSYGVLALSKQGMLTPLYCWLIPVCALRFRLSILQLIACLIGVLIVFQYLVPYSQYGRRLFNGNPSISQRSDLAVRLLSHPERTRQLYLTNQTPGDVGYHYFNSPQGLWDRLNFIAIDDSLIDLTDRGVVFGFEPIAEAFVNAVPHFILPNKPTLNFGNTYAHEFAALSEDDTTTGIAYSPSSEAYHLGRWMGVLVAAPLIWLLLFVVLDSLLGDIRTTPWGLLALALISHIAPEGGITGAIYLLTYGTAIFAFCALFAKWVAPAFAILLLGRNSRLHRQAGLLPALAPRGRGRATRLRVSKDVSA